jgi:hypothetical protein
MDTRSPLYTKTGSSINGDGRAGQANGPSNGAARSVKFTVNGRVLYSDAIEQMTPAERALLAADLQKNGWSARQAQLLTGASPSYVHTAYYLTDQQRQLIDRGYASLSEFHNARKLDLEIEAFIRRRGADRVMAALDRMTEPTPVAAIPPSI